MHRETCIFNSRELPVPDRLDPVLYVRPVAMMTFLAVDEQNGACNPAQELVRLRGVKRLGRRCAVERIESPNPFAGGGLSHPAARQVQCERGFNRGFVCSSWRAPASTLEYSLK